MKAVLSGRQTAGQGSGRFYSVYKGKGAVMKSRGGGGAERLFSGKRKFHKAMAKLPIEEKIRIVASLQRIDYSIKPAAWKKRMMWVY